jgi:hypothetical protein
MIFLFLIIAVIAFVAFAMGYTLSEMKHNGRALDRINRIKDARRQSGRRTKRPPAKDDED